MQTIDFYKLSRPVQERFVGSTNGMGLPSPILRAPARPREPLLLLALSAALVLALVAKYRIGYGDLASAYAIQSVISLGIDIALVAVAAAAVLRALAIWRDLRVSPFRRGIYVFPVGLIDARTALLRMYPIEDLGEVNGPNASGDFTLAFGGRRFGFAVKDAAEAEAARTQLASARGQIDDAGAARESMRPKALAALDPLQGFANPLASSEPMVRRAPAWAKFGWAFGLVLGAVAGSSVWAVHNAMSDDAMYARASTQNDVQSLRAYLAKGARHKEKVAGELLPRAELSDAVKAGSVDAIERYIKEHPTTAIGDEVTAALKTSLQKELDAARQAGTLSALDAFVAKHPQSHLDADIATARHAVYQAALARYKEQAPAKGLAEIALVERLLAFAEKKGPPVEVRFHRLESKTMDKADTAVQKNKLFKGVVSDPSRYFDAAHAKPHEDDLAATVIARFSQAFPAEILAFAVGEPIADPAAPLPPSILVPTIFIEHGPSWSGNILATHNPNGVFVGLQLSYDAYFRLPDDPKPLHVSTDAWKGPATLAAKGDDKPEETIYGKMQDEGFDQFKKKLVGSFFKLKMIAKTPYLTAALLSLLLACSRTDAPPAPGPAASASAAIAPGAKPGIHWIQGPAGLTDVTSAVKDAYAREHSAGRTLLVYVGATWCEPCQRFHHAVDEGKLDGAFPALTIVGFDADKDTEALANGGYFSTLIPLLALPNADGHASGKQIEGGIKGEGAVADIAPRLQKLISGT